MYLMPSSLSWTMQNRSKHNNSHLSKYIITYLPSLISNNSINTEAKCAFDIEFISFYKSEIEFKGNEHVLKSMGKYLHFAFVLNNNNTIATVRCRY